MIMYHDMNESLLGPEDLPWNDYNLGTCDHDDWMPDVLLLTPGLGSRVFVTSYLAQHQGIQVIGPEYFTYQWPCREASWYKDHIIKYSGKVIVDASGSLVFLPAFAIDKIKAMKPDIRIIIILQHPEILCKEFIQSRYFYHKGVFAHRDLYLDDVPDSMILESLIRDELMTRIDYEALVRRWVSVFPESQVSVAYLENTLESSTGCVKHVFDFIEGEGLSEEQQINTFKPLSYGIGLNLDCQPVKDFMDEIIHRKSKSFYHFLEYNNLPLPPWKNKQAEGNAPTLYVEKRNDWKIYLKSGLFHAVNDDCGLSCQSGFLSDIRQLVGDKGNKRVESVSLEDNRLCNILTEAAQKSIPEKKSIGRIDTLNFVEDYNLYNILKSGDRYIAVRQSLGQVGLFREKLGEREMAPHILKAQTCDAIKMKIDHVQIPDDLKYKRNDNVGHWI